MCFQYLYIKKYKIEPPQITKTVNSMELSALIKSQLKSGAGSVYMADYKYKLAPKSEYVRMIKHDKTDLLPYIEDFLDCDDSAVSLKGAFTIPKWSALPFGMLSVSYTTITGKIISHRVNIFIDDEYLVWIVEPQRDTYWLPDDKDWIYHYADF